MRRSLVQLLLGVYILFRLLGSPRIFEAATFNLLFIDGIALYLALGIVVGRNALHPLRLPRQLLWVYSLTALLIVTTSGINLLDVDRLFSSPDVARDTEYFQRHIFVILFNAVILSYVIVNTIKEKSDLLYLARLFMFAGIVIAGTGLLQYFEVARIINYDSPMLTGPERRLVGVRGVGGGSNILLMSSFFTLYYIKVCRQHYRRMVGVIALLLQLVALYYTFTRSAYVGLAATVVTYFALAASSDRSPLKRKTIGRLILVTALLIGFLDVVGFSEHVEQHDRWEGGIIGARHFETRVERWRALGEEIQKKPLLGHGIGTEAAVGSRHYGWSTAHSLYVKILVETGVIGLVLYIGLMILILWTLYKGRRLAMYSGHVDIVLFSDILIALAMGLSTIRIVESYRDFDVFQFMFLGLAIAITSGMFRGVVYKRRCTENRSIWSVNAN